MRLELEPRVTPAMRAVWEEQLLGGAPQLAADHRAAALSAYRQLRAIAQRAAAAASSDSGGGATVWLQRVVKALQKLMDLVGGGGGGGGSGGGAGPGSTAHSGLR